MTIHVTSGREGRREKKRRIYLKEPHDYFGLNYVRKMQELQRQLAQEGKEVSPLSQFNSAQAVNGIVPSKSWRTSDLYNKSRGMYLVEEKRYVLGEESPHGRSADSISFGESLVNQLNRFFGSSSDAADKRHTESQPLVNNASRRRTYSDESAASAPELYSTAARLTRPRTVSECSSDSGRKQVHFSPETLCSDRERKPLIWGSLLEKRRAAVKRHADTEDTLRPRPFLPYLESGLSYRDDEEFYKLKNNEAHRNAQLRIMQRNYHRERSHCLRVIIRRLRLLCCLSSGKEEHESSLESVVECGRRRKKRV